MSQDVQQSAMMYYQLVQQGVPPAQAFAQAFPKGLPNSAKNREEAAKKAAKKQQEGNLAAVGGTLAGALTAKGVSDLVASGGDEAFGYKIGGASDSASSAATTTSAPPVEISDKAALAGEELLKSGSVSTIPQGAEIPEGYTAVGTSAKDGSTIIANSAATESVEASGVTLGDLSNYLGYAVALYQGYDTWKNRKDLSDKQEAIGYSKAGLTAANVYAGGGNPYLSAATGALNVYDTYSNDNLTSEQQAARAQQQIGAAVIDYYYPGLGTLLDTGLQSTKFGRKLTDINAKYSPISQGIASFGSGKSGEQMARDKVRDRLANIGVINKDDWSIKFGDGSSFDIGKDGGARLTNEAGDRRQYSDVDFSNQFAGSTVGAVNPLAAILTGGNERLRSDTAGWYTNAVLNGAPDESTINVRIKDLYSQHGISEEQANQAIDKLLEKKRIDEATAAAYRNGLVDVFRGVPTKTVAPSAATPRTDQVINKPIGQPGPAAQQLLQGLGASNQPPSNGPQWANPASGSIDPGFNMGAAPTINQPQIDQLNALAKTRKLTPQEQWRLNRAKGLV